MKRLLFLIVLFACVAVAHVQRHDAVYIDGKRCSFFSNPLNLCDYVIIRHDGKIEYGPKSDLLNYWQRSLLPRKTSPLLPKKQ